MTQTIVDLTPTWAAILPMLCVALQDGTPKGRDIARKELERMAALADERNRIAPEWQGMVTALRDAKALLETLTGPRPRNWDGSTEGQARSTARDIAAILARIERTA